MKKVIKFYANWCGPCKAYTPVFDRVKNSTDEVEFIEVNIDNDDAGLAAEMKVRSIPHTTLVLEDGSTKQFSGIMSETQLREFIDG
mgnify:CR=1 FL=1|jgi:thioredoxin-like negative regulator of GroEL